MAEKSSSDLLVEFHVEDALLLGGFILLEITGFPSDFHMQKGGVGVVLTVTVEP